MDRLRTALQKTPPVSLLITALSLGIPLLTTFWSTRTNQPPSPVRVFNAETGLGLDTIPPILLDKDARTNRTVWETVSTTEIHAGLQRVEVHSWIPPHSHPTEEIVVVCNGVGHVYDENGQFQHMRTGSMIHIRAQARHAFRNVGEEPLYLMWLFPSLFATDKFKFQQRYPRP